jgi:hypothetical protein
MFHRSRRDEWQYNQDILQPWNWKKTTKNNISQNQKVRATNIFFLILTHIKFGIMDFLLAKPLKHWYHTLQSSEIGQYIIIYYCSSPI